jgi:hypothetical protein
MAFANWKSKKSKSATATLATVATHEEKTGDYLPSVATVATVAGLESSKLAANDHHLKNVVENISPQMEENFPSSMDRYTHLTTCQHCQHLTLTGHCKVKPQYKPMIEALRDCASFEMLQGERVAIANAPYSVSELNDLLSRYEQKLFYHLVDCEACSFMDSRYCVDAFAIGSSYDALLLVFDDAANKREALLNTVIRARISGRKVFIGLDYANIGEPQQQAVKPLVYGIGDSERLFVNHLMTCDKCKPTSRTYCADGLKLKAHA